MSGPEPGPVFPFLGAFSALPSPAEPALGYKVALLIDVFRCIYHHEKLLKGFMIFLYATEEYSGYFQAFKSTTEAFRTLISLLTSI